MSTRSHWTEVPALSVLTMRANEVPSVADYVGDDDVLVIQDDGNQEAFVLRGDVNDWEFLAELIQIRCRSYRQGVGRTQPL